MIDCNISFLGALGLSTPLLMLIMALPHCLYCVIWLQPYFWRNAFGKTSVDALMWIALGLKALQAAACVAWMAERNGGSVCPDPDATTPAHWMLALPLLATGQLLNASVYRRLGKAGVYYGCRLGHKVPWVYGFPFSVVPHPQYAGCVLTAAGIAALFSASVPAVVPVATYVATLYCTSAFIEHVL